MFLFLDGEVFPRHPSRRSFLVFVLSGTKVCEWIGIGVEDFGITKTDPEVGESWNTHAREAE